MKINIGNNWIDYSDISELKDTLANHDVRLGNDVTLGNWVRLGNDVTLGDRVTLGNDVTLGNRVTLGDDVTLGNRVRLEQNPFYVCSELPFIFNGYNDRIQIGCRDYTVEYWLENYKKIASETGITDEQIIEKYYQLIKLYSTWEGVAR
jgi:acyl-[acyl carrier protein]--UDP-N-acetylglucosamine O-acyltransferase